MVEAARYRGKNRRRLTLRRFFSAAAGATTVRATNATTAAPHSTAALEVSCPPGTVPTGEGFALAQPLNMVGLSKKSGENTIVAKALSLTGSDLAFNGCAVCLAISFFPQTARRTGRR